MLRSLVDSSSNSPTLGLLNRDSVLRVPLGLAVRNIFQGISGGEDHNSMCVAGFLITVEGLVEEEPIAVLGGISVLLPRPRAQLKSDDFLVQSHSSISTKSV